MVSSFLVMGKLIGAETCPKCTVLLVSAGVVMSVDVEKRTVRSMQCRSCFEASLLRALDDDEENTSDD